MQSLGPLPLTYLVNEKDQSLNYNSSEIHKILKNWNKIRIENSKNMKKYDATLMMYDKTVLTQTSNDFRIVDIEDEHRCKTYHSKDFIQNFFNLHIICEDYVEFTKPFEILFMAENKNILKELLIRIDVMFENHEKNPIDIYAIDFCFKTNEKPLKLVFKLEEDILKNLKHITLKCIILDINYGICMSRAKSLSFKFYKLKLIQVPHGFGNYFKKLRIDFQNKLNKSLNSVIIKLRFSADHREVFYKARIPPMSSVSFFCSYSETVRLKLSRFLTV